MSLFRRFFPAVFLLTALTVLSGCALFKPDYSNLAFSEKVKLKNFYSSNMIFQREAPAVIQGTGTPGTKIKVTFNKDVEFAKVDKDGNWVAKLPEQPVGGPYEVTIEGKKKLVLKNVLVGDIWFCSGQSNMEWHLRNTNNAKEALSVAEYPQIRLFHTSKGTSPESERANAGGTWRVATPASAKHFSAVGFYFGRKLNKDLKVPIGLINSSWGGTRIQPWISRETFEKNPEFQSSLDNLDLTIATYKAKDKSKKVPNYIAQWVKRVEEYYTDKKAQEWSIPGKADFKTWGKTTLPNGFNANGLTFDGVVWFVKEVDMPEKMLGKDLTLSMGSIDDCDKTFFNGQKVGETGPEVDQHWSAKRVYKVPASLVKPGKNLIAIRVLDTYSDGGFRGPEEIMFLKSGTDKISLASEWFFKTEYKIDYKKFAHRPPAFNGGIKSPQLPTTLFNAMVAPFVKFPIKGAIWYQGESNAGEHGIYDDLMEMLVTDWRTRWDNPEMPFLWVQLAAFHGFKPKKEVKDFFSTLPPAPTNNWSFLRDDQRKALRVPNTGMAVTIDIGDPFDIHPRNKKDVGERLALIAENKVYGKDVYYSGPVYKSCKIEGDKIRVFFDEKADGLVAKGGKLKTFIIAGKDKKFVKAEAKLDGDSILVWSDKVKSPVAVRYAWEKYPEGCNLYNTAGLPAGPFRTDNW